VVSSSSGVSGNVGICDSFVPEPDIGVSLLATIPSR
jgi:hypothetical protein